MRDVGAVLDVNAAPIRKIFGPVYPAPEILARARAMGIGVTLGDDSHGPNQVGVGLDDCVATIAAAGYDAVMCLHRRDGALGWERVPLDQVRPQVP